MAGQILNPNLLLAVPLAPLVRGSGLSAVGGIEAGAPSRLMPRPGGAIGVAICYEIADGRGLAEASRAGWRKNL